MELRLVFNVLPAKHRRRCTGFVNLRGQFGSDSGLLGFELLEEIKCVRKMLIKSNVIVVEV